MNGYLASRSSFSCTASRMNLARPYVPTALSSCASVSGGKLTCTRVWFRGGRPIGRAVAGAGVCAKKIVSFSLASVNCALYINVTVYGGNPMSKPTNCPTCKERTFHRVTVEGRVCNMCDAIKLIRARTAKSQRRQDATVALFRQYAPDLFA